MSVLSVFLIIALILFILSAFNVSSPINLTAAGLACCVIAVLIGQHFLA